MIGAELEASLYRAFSECRKQRHEFVTVEHLLLALLDAPSAVEVLDACSANVGAMRKSLTQFIAEKWPVVDERIATYRLPALMRGIQPACDLFIRWMLTAIGRNHEIDSRPTPGFEQVIQRAIRHSMSTGRETEVTAADVLVAIFGESYTYAVRCLHQQDVTRLDVVSFIAYGIKKSDHSAPVQNHSPTRLLSENGRVILLNDDYTPMEFVVMVLREYFNFDLEAAEQMMLKIHQDGRGVCGVFSQDVAATKVELVSNAARLGGHPLQCILEAA